MDLVGPAVNGAGVRLQAGSYRGEAEIGRLCGALKSELKVECRVWLFESVSGMDAADAAYRDVLKGGA